MELKSVGMMKFSTEWKHKKCSKPPWHWKMCSDFPKKSLPFKIDLPSSATDQINQTTWIFAKKYWNDSQEKKGLR
jgi:hypothetical protein